MKEIKKAEARFRSGLDDDIKAKFTAVPEKERSTILRDALRLWFGISSKKVIKQMEVPLSQQPERQHIPIVQTERRVEERQEYQPVSMPKIYKPK